ESPAQHELKRFIRLETAKNFAPARDTSLRVGPISVIPYLGLNDRVDEADGQEYQRQVHRPAGGRGLGPARFLRPAPTPPGAPPSPAAVPPSGLRPTGPAAQASGGGFRYTFYAPGATGTMEGGFVTSRKNLEGSTTPRTLDDVRLGRSS